MCRYYILGHEETLYKILDVILMNFLQFGSEGNSPDHVK